MLKFLFYTTTNEKIALVIFIVVILVFVAASLVGNEAGQTLTSAITRH